MKIKKADLLKFIEDAIARGRKAHAEAHQQAVRAEYDRVAQWEDKFGTQWDEALKTLATARRRKKPITQDMLPGLAGKDYVYLGSILSFGSELNLPVTKPFVIPRDLAGTRNLVRAISDEEIDVKQLSMGDIRDLYRNYGSDD